MIAWHSVKMAIFSFIFSNMFMAILQQKKAKTRALQARK